MVKRIGGIALAGVVLWVWGFLFWQVNPLAYASWQSTADDVAAQTALRQHFPNSGLYYLPSLQRSPEEQQELLNAGPWGFVEISYAKRAPVEVSMLLGGLALDLLFAAVLGMLMLRLRNQSRTFSGRLGVPLWTGLAAVVLIEGGDVIWWNATLAWQLQQALYDFSAFLVTGAVLAVFIKADARERLV